MSVKPELIEPEAESESQSELAESALKELLW
jgi:hypothetical protein